MIKLFLSRWKASGVMGGPVIRKYGNAARFDVNFITISSFFVKAASHHFMIAFSFSRFIQNKEAFRKKGVL